MLTRCTSNHQEKNVACDIFFVGPQRDLFYMTGIPWDTG